MTSTHRSSLYRQLLFAVALYVSCSGVAFGQAAARPDRGTMPNRTYAVSDIENVSLQNGNVNLSIPLAALPPIAGGKLSWVVSASYNSKLWNVTRSQRNDDPLVWQPYVVDTPQLSDLGGWRIGGAYQISFRNANDDFQRITYLGNSGLENWERDLLNNHQWYKVVLRMPDGSEHEFRPTDFSPYSGNEDFLRGYYKDIPAGSPMRYYSVDGSYLFATINTTLDWTVFMPDGTKVIQTTDGIQRIQDTNGNKIKIFTQGGVGHYQDEQTNREITTSCPSATLCQVWYPTVNGILQHIDINFGTTTVQGKLRSNNQNGCEWNEGLPATGPLQMEVVRAIILPQTELAQQQRRFTFSYNSDTTVTAVDTVTWSCPPSPESYSRTASYGWGELSQMVTPSGSIVDYSFTLDGIHNLQQYSTDSITTQSITQKKITHDGTFDVWTYAISDTFGSVTNPDGTGAAEQKYCASPGAVGCATDKSGLVYRSSRPFMMTERHWTKLQFSGANIDAPGGIIAINPVVDFEYTTLLDANSNKLRMSAKAFQYDYNGNVTQTTEYDWFDPTLVSRDAQGVPTAVPGSATVLRVTNNAYYNQATASFNVYAKRSNGAPLILNALKEMTAGPSIVQLSYDEQGYGSAPTAGNLTSQKIWDDFDGKWITSSQTYDSYGNLASKTDANGKVTQLIYADATHALPTSVVVDPENGTGPQTSQIAYDQSTGLVISTTDPNGGTTNIYYTNPLLNGSIDPFGRPGVVIGPLVTAGGVSQHHRTTTTYLDSVRQIKVASDLNSEDDQLLKTRTTVDQLGRVILSEQSEDGTNYTISSQTVYNPQDRMTFTSNPHRTGTATTNGWTRTTTDTAGRIVEVATFSGSIQPGAGTADTKVVTSYDGEFTTVTDQALKVRRSKTDALGRLVRVDEPNGANSLGTTSSPEQATSYTYDSLGNLRRVVQGQQQRFFMYDSLSRLRRAANPEQQAKSSLAVTDPITNNSQWSIAYTYDDNGNLTQKTDARGIGTTFLYDALNRVTSRSYQSDPTGTPGVTYSYDSTSIINGKGRLASVSSSVSTYSYSGYDAMGRVAGGTQMLGGQPYPMSYEYDLAGHVTKMTYPSTRKVNYAYDAAGRANSVTGTLGKNPTAQPDNYATGIIYDAGGRMTKEQFGTTTPVYNKLFYNVRGQLAEIRAGTTYTGPTDTNSDRGAIVNRYSLQSGCLGASCNATDNNGNLRRQDISIPNNGTFTQIYEYDSLNRLQSVRENKDGGATNWQQAYTYDRHGNRSIDQSGTTQGVGINSMQASVVQNTLTNRIYAPGETEQNHPLIDYDPAGNQRRDYYSDNSPRNIDYDSTYDAENRMKTSTATYSNPADTQTSTYTYDGDGRRVKRTVGNTETWQVYGLGGELLAEYAVNGSPSSPQKEYGYRNGQLLVEVTATTAGWGPPPVIDDNPLELNVTTVQSRHITQLRTAINALRTHMQMSNYNWAYSATTSDWISANPILEMRIALNQALGAPSTPYSAGLAYEEPIKAIHIQELRDRVLAAWMTGTGGVDFRWLVADQLGTPRIIIDKTGALANVTRHDYLPFGEELFADTGLRTTTQGYTSAGSIAADGSRQKFTSKERDNETGLDYFGARYYASTQGRFTSTDPLLSTGYPGSPQTWNRYSYTLNNPLRLIDPTGMFVIDPNLSTDDQDKIKAGYNQLKASLGNYKPGSSDYKRIQRALKTLGGIGVKNGITVTVGSTLNEGAGAQVVPTGIDYRGKKPVGLHATITIASGDFKSNTEAGIGEALGHEATHAADFKDLALAGVGVDKLWAAFDAIRYKSEFEAYMLSGAVRQALGPATAYEAPGNIPVSESNQLPWTLGKVSLWNPAWAVLDASKIQTQRSWAINSVLMTPKKQGGHYGLEPPKR